MPSKLCAASYAACRTIEELVHIERPITELTPLCTSLPTTVLTLFHSACAPIPLFIRLDAPPAKPSYLFLASGLLAVPFVLLGLRTKRD